MTATPDKPWLGANPDVPSPGARLVIPTELLEDGELEERSGSSSSRRSCSGFRGTGEPYYLRAVRVPHSPVTLPSDMPHPSGTLRRHGRSP